MSRTGPFNPMPETEASLAAAKAFRETMMKVRRSSPKEECDALVSALGDIVRSLGFCIHDQWTFEKQGRCCFGCGVMMLDFGD